MKVVRGLFLISFFLMSVEGQVTIPNMEDFTIGLRLKYQKCDTSGVVPGNSGANQIWDLSSLVPISDSTVQWVDSPATAPYGNLFPEANLVEIWGDGRFVFVNKTDSASYLVGFEDTTDAYPPLKYSDPMLFAKRPISYGETIVDTFILQGYPGTGIITIEADGYGTLILPNGTYNNVLRVKITETHPYFQYTLYTWFDGVHTASLLKIDGETVEYLIEETTGLIEERNGENQILIFPNPLRRQAELRSKEFLQDATIVVFNSVGQIVRVMDNLSGNLVIFQREHLPAGAYVMCLLEKDRVIFREKIVILD